MGIIQEIRMVSQPFSFSLFAKYYNLFLTSAQELLCLPFSHEMVLTYIGNVMGKVSFLNQLGSRRPTVETDYTSHGPNTLYCGTIFQAIYF